MDPKELLDDLIFITSRLSEIMKLEIDLVLGRKFKELNSLQTDKARLAASYEGQMRLLAETPELFAAIEPVLRKEISEKLEAFSKLAKENENHLRAAREINERLIQTIAKAVKEQQSKTGAYSSQGDVSENSKANNVSMAVNETF